MIVVRVNLDKDELAVIRITNLENGDTELADYSVEIAVYNAGDVTAFYQRSFDFFPRKRLNVLALLLQALNTLEEEELLLHGNPDAARPSNLAGRLNRAMRQV